MGERRGMSMKAERNMFAVVNGMPCVHIKGHVSKHFNVARITYMYINTKECSEAEFKACCEKHGWMCKIDKGDIFIQGTNYGYTNRIWITADGDVFVDDKHFTNEPTIASSGIIRF